MGKYNDIWTRVKGFEETKKDRKKKSREEKIKLIKKYFLRYLQLQNIRTTFHFDYTDFINYNFTN